MEIHVHGEGVIRWRYMGRCDQVEVHGEGVIRWRYMYMGRV